MRHTVTFYHKSDCHLCHEVRALLTGLQREFTFSIEEVDIVLDPVLESQYRHSIPVVLIDGQIELASPVLERELRAVLQ